MTNGNSEFMTNQRLGLKNHDVPSEFNPMGMDC